MPIHQNALKAGAKAISGLRRKKKAPEQLALPGTTKTKPTVAKTAAPTNTGAARSAAQQRFKDSGNKTSAIQKPKKSLLRRAGAGALKLSVPSVVGSTLAIPAGEALGETAFNIANPDYDPNFNPATSFARNLKEDLAPVTQAVTDFAVGDPGNAGPDFFPNPNAPAAATPNNGDPRSSLRAAGPQDTGGTVNTVPAFQAPTGAAAPTTPALPPLPRAQSTSPTFGEKQEIRSARLGVGKLRSGFLSEGEVQAQQTAAQSRLDTAQAAPGLRVTAQTAQRGQDASAQQSQAKSQAAAAKAAQDGLSFRDRLALRSQLFQESRAQTGDDQKANAAVFKSIDEQFGKGTDRSAKEKAIFTAQVDPTYSFKDNFGRVARRNLKEELVDGSNAERGLFDFIATFFGGEGPVGESEKLDIQFDGWTIDANEERIVAPDGSNSFYFDDFSSDENALLVQQMVRADNQGGQQPQGLR